MGFLEVDSFVCVFAIRIGVLGGIFGLLLIYLSLRGGRYPIMDFRNWSLHLKELFAFNRVGQCLLFLVGMGVFLFSLYLITQNLIALSPVHC
ncbi:hypothetical protein LQ236_002349 [Nitrospina gracilis]|nr:hypothetical protein [Nitrospina sp. Nb-3]